MKPIHFTKQQVLHASIAALATILTTVVQAQTAAQAPANTTAPANTGGAENPNTGSKNSLYPDDDGNLSGDKFRLQSNLYKISKFGESNETHCAPKASKLHVRVDEKNQALFRFTRIGGPNDGCKKEENIVNDYTLYTKPSSELKREAGVRSGVQFGGLIVPFKYNLSTKKLDSSPTIAPFIGYRTDWEPGGLAVIPVAMLGVSMKTGTNTGSGTQASLSSGAGLRLTSSKNENWQAGILFGRDFGGGTEAGAPGTSTQGKAFNWFSAFLGYSM